MLSLGSKWKFVGVIFVPLSVSAGRKKQGKHRCGRRRRPMLKPSEKLRLKPKRLPNKKRKQREKPRQKRKHCEKLCRGRAAKTGRSAKTDHGSSLPPIIYREQLNLVQLGINGADVNFKLHHGVGQICCVRIPPPRLREANPSSSLSVLLREVQEFGMSADGHYEPREQNHCGSQWRQTCTSVGASITDERLRSMMAPPSYWCWLTPARHYTETAAWLWSMEPCTAAPDFRTPRVNTRAQTHSKFRPIPVASAHRDSQGSQGGVDGNCSCIPSRACQPALSGHAGTFADVKVVANAVVPCFASCETRSTLPALRHAGRQARRCTGDFRLQPRQVLLRPCRASTFRALVAGKHDMLYLTTKMGFLYMFFIHRISDIFAADPAIYVATCTDSRTGSLGVTARGQVLVTVNERASSTTCSMCRNRTCTRRDSLGVGGADNLFQGEFERLMQAQQYEEAARLAARTPGDALRNMGTIQRFQALPAVREACPCAQYFQSLLEIGKLNEVESIEFVRLLQQGRKQLLEKWLKEDKLTCSEDLVTNRPLNHRLWPWRSTCAPTRPARSSTALQRGSVR